MAKETKTVKCEIRNIFHNTSKTVRLYHGKNVISGRRMQIWEKELCGVEECACSGYAGIKGDFYTPAIQTLDGVACEWDYQHDSKTDKTVCVVWVD
jgi:hypothetical protein